VNTAPDASTSDKTLRYSIQHLPVSNTGVFPELCLFCSSSKKSSGKHKTKEVLGNCETVACAQIIQDAVQILCDEQLLANISGIDLISKEAKYHLSCKKLYLQRSKRSLATSDHSLEKSHAHKTAFNELKCYIDKTFIDVCHGKQQNKIFCPVNLSENI
jgi:hypothetical protein